jgi:dTDP-4-amino-4,6-dideoxygalactose transaminase
MSLPIWFNRPATVGRELDYISEALVSGHISGDGAFTKRCHTVLAELSRSKRAFLTTSCTHALELAMLLVDVGPGDEVILPSFTFVSTANAIALRGATPVFVDVRADTLNLDESRIEAAISPRTRAIIVVHYAGVACAMDAIGEIARRHNLVVVEDNAHGLFGHYKSRPLGGFGALSTLSFHETKNVTCGEGGALLVNDERYIERAEILREKGTNRARFFRGQVDRYTWVDVGSSYLPSEILAAYLLAQLETRAEIQRRRHEMWARYDRELCAWARAAGVVTPTVPADCGHPAHLFYLVLPSLEARTKFIDHMKDNQVLAVFHYQPLHLSAMGRRFGSLRGDCPVTEQVADRLVRLPLYFSLSADEQRHVIDAVVRFEGA